MPTLAPDELSRAEIKARLADRWWRLNNLYWIKDEKGRVVKFKPNAVQTELEDNLHTRNLIPKSRQHGITTWACIRALDTALFRPNSACGMVFHVQQKAREAFRTKVMYAYDHLPSWLRAEVRTTKRDQSGIVEFENGSSIECSTSHRGGTLQYLHISEYGPMVAQFPLRAEEVSSGALNTVHADPNTIITIESTAMGAWGDFYDRVQRARVQERLVEAGQAVRTILDWKLFFFPWWMDPKNKLDATGVEISEKQEEYFLSIEAEFECRLFPEQKAWYVKKLEEQKDKMRREHPSTLDEAFQGSVEGAYYAAELAQAEGDGRICDLPFVPTLPVYTFWDIGRSDSTAIWFMQAVGPWLHFIRYYENSGQGAAHYANLLTKLRDEKGYRYECHYLPHDAGVADWSQGDNRTRKQVLEDMKIGRVEVVDRIENLLDGIEMTRQMFSRCKFDKTACGEDPIGSGRGGLPALRAYRRGRDIKTETWTDRPLKSWANHGADALRQCAQGYESPPDKPPKKKPKRGRSAMTI